MKKYSYDIEELKASLKSKYGSIREAAERLGLSEENLHGKIKTQSSKFIKELKDNGLILPRAIGEKPDLNEYPILSRVYAGSSPSLFVAENILDYVTLPYPKKENCFAVVVRGDSMNHKIEEGDTVLADMEKEIYNTDIVIARFKNGEQIIKRYRKINEIEIMFYSDNGNYIPLIKNINEIEAIYRIVGIWKKV